MVYICIRTVHSAQQMHIYATYLCRLPTSHQITKLQVCMCINLRLLFHIPKLWYIYNINFHL